MKHRKRGVKRTRDIPSPKQHSIICQIREGISNGTYKPGQKLPTRSEYEEMFDTTRVTIQRAFAKLILDETVTTRRQKGSFVAEKPPQITKYALVIPSMEEDQGWAKFWIILRNLARSYDRGGDRWVSVYTGIDAGKPGPDFQKLEQDVVNHRLAGVIFASHPFLVQDSPIFLEPGMPRVAFMGPTERVKFPVLTFHTEGFLDRALDYLAERGRKRIALITVPGFTDATHEYFRNGVTKRGMTVKPHWLQIGLQTDPRWVAHVIVALLGEDTTVRPDGIVVVDDNLTEHVCTGILQAGRRVPEDLDIVSHTNFPAPSGVLLPIARLGYDLREIMEASFTYLDMQRRHETPPPVTAIQPKFEHELATAKVVTPVFMK